MRFTPVKKSDDDDEEKSWRSYIKTKRESVDGPARTEASVSMRGRCGTRYKKGTMTTKVDKAAGVWRQRG